MSHVYNATYPDEDPVFGLHLAVETSGDPLDGLLYAEFLHQWTPVRLEQITDCRNRADSHQSAHTLVVTTSSFALNAVEVARESKVVLVLIASVQRKDRVFRIAIMDGEVIEYPRCELWSPVKLVDRYEFARLRSWAEAFELHQRGS